ncbi:MAG: ABC transporter permease [Candidatus Korobacteraceae bacterium]
MNRMIVANLLHRPIRSLVSVVAIAVEVTLILVIVGLSLGMLNDAKQRTAGIGADIIVQPPGSSFLAGLSGAPVSIRVADVLRKLPHVTEVAPVIWHLSATGSVEVIYGIDAESFQRLGGPFRFISGGPFTGPNQVIVDDFFAASENVTAGDSIEILNHKFEIAGVVQNGRGARKFLPIETLQELIGAQDKASVFYVKVDNPANVEPVAKSIHQVDGMQQYKVLSMREYLTMMTAGNLPGLQQFIEVVIGVAVVIGFIVIFQAMYTAVLERTREIGILKSMGASKLYVVNVVVRETLVLAAVGTVVGIIVSYAAKNAIRARFPTLPVEIQPDWIVYAAIIALVGAILGAIYPAYKAAQKDPIDALAYE